LPRPSGGGTTFFLPKMFGCTQTGNNNSFSIPLMRSQLTLVPSPFLQKFLKSASSPSKKLSNHLGSLVFLHYLRCSFRCRLSLIVDLTGIIRVLLVACSPSPAICDQAGRDSVDCQCTAMLTCSSVSAATQDVPASDTHLQCHHHLLGQQ
jgi:hypothetical protein